MEISTIGLDLAKSIFQVHAVDASGEIVVRKALRRPAKQSGTQLADTIRASGLCRPHQQAGQRTAPDQTAKISDLPLQRGSHPQKTSCLQWRHVWNVGRWGLSGLEPEDWESSLSFSRVIALSYCTQRPAFLLRRLSPAVVSLINADRNWNPEA
jgi:hypothetical protein